MDRVLVAPSASSASVAMMVIRACPGAATVTAADGASAAATDTVPETDTDPTLVGIEESQRSVMAAQVLLGIEGWRYAMT